MSSRSGRSRGAPVVRLLGAVGVRRDDGAWTTPPRLDGLVLAHLTLAEGRTLTVDDLIDAVWEDDPPERARNALQVKVSRLRGLLGERGTALSYSPGGYRLALTSDDTDVGAFVEELRSGQELVRQDPAAAVEVLTAALDRWYGDALADLGDHPRLVAARARLSELRTVAAEAHAEALLAHPDTRGHGVAALRSVLEAEPLRPRARVLLMEALDASGRRAEALAVYDAGRRLYAHAAGLEPPEEVRLVFERMLDAEREATRRAAATTVDRGVPEGLAATVRWVADDGDVDAALGLALRGTWWWWLSGQRSLGQDLLTDLVDRARLDGSPVDGRAVLSARAWTSLYESLGPGATDALARGRQTLELVGRPAWSRHDCLAATLVAERLVERGERESAGRLLDLATREQARRGDEWGQAFCAVVGARALLSAGDVTGALQRTESQLRRFLALGDLAGQVSCLDVIGTCLEAMGELPRAAEAHTRALALARRAGAPEWEAGHLVQLGNVGVLAERPDAVADLDRAGGLSAALGADAVTACCHNGLGVAHAFAGDHVAAAEEHRAAHSWYDVVGSLSGLAYTGARLALATEDPVGAASSVRVALRTADPRAVAHSLEAVALTTPDHARAARGLGAAAALRSASSDRLAEPHERVLGARRTVLREALGSAAYDVLVAEGGAEPLVEAGHW